MSYNRAIEASNPPRHKDPAGIYQDGVMESERIIGNLETDVLRYKAYIEDARKELKIQERRLKSQRERLATALEAEAKELRGDKP